jgi:chemotaxis protein MotB
MRVVGWILLVLLGIALAVGGFMAKSHYAGLLTERDEQRQRISELERELLRIQTERSESDKRVSAAQQNLKATQAELEQLRVQRAEAERRLEMVKELTSKFKKMIDDGKLNVLVRGDRMIVKMPAEVLFESGSAELSPDGQATLKEIAGVLKSDPSRKLMVAGHTDNQPIADAKYRSNWQLSAERAVMVTEFLVNVGIRPTNLVAAGYSQHDPVGDNRSVGGRRDNRRIELVIQPPSLGALPGIVEGVASAASSASPPASATPVASAAPATSK